MTTGVGCDGNQIIVARAKVVLGNLIVETPFIQSISVNRERGTSQSKASCTLRIDSNQVSSASPGDVIFISFYGKAVFTGVVRRMQVQPSPQCSGEYFLTIQAEDPLYKLQNKRVTRRQKLEGLGPIALISSKVDQPERGFDSPGINTESPHSQFGSTEGTQVPAEKTNPRELTRLMGPESFGTYGENHPITKASRRLNEQRGGSTGSSLGIHDHSNLENLGPANAVYSTK